MISEDKIRDYYFDLKDIIYIERDEDGNVLHTNDPSILSYYDEIINSDIVENNQYYHIDSKKWYEVIKVNFYNDKTSSFHMIEYIEDVTNLKEKFSKLKLDSLTGLMRNREECNKLIDEYITKALDSKEEFSILIGDIDYFKTVNDTYGHHCGDFVLRVVGKLLLSCTKQSSDEYDSANNDIVLRFGGDEFLIFLKNVSEEETIEKVNEITSKIKKEKLNYDDQTISVSMSFGYAHSSTQNLNTEEVNVSEIRENLSKKADEILYEVKKNRNY